MNNDDIRRNMPLFPMGIVTKLTELTPRQIRYYEQHELIQPERTDGKQRLFSFRDVDRLLVIKSLMEKGLNIAGVKEMLEHSQNLSEVKREVEEARIEAMKQKPELTQQDLLKKVRQDLINIHQPGSTHLTLGELSRFFRH
ncbi:MerR family transcriptional regulator [Risungbinella massiliensis]|uniref:MerR family transcriptional regulator n=1 Tax=Risungbinella massiliensis TaxID=1329796 RepID=UPI0005CC4F7B|nr:MerR family transcriptional regulator [Risungbinella massiliensis]